MNKDKYINNLTEDTPIFHQPYWLDYIADKQWDVALVEKEGRVIASMPYGIKKGRTSNFIFMPILTQFLGPHFNIDPSIKLVNQYNKETEILQQLLKQIPPFGFFSQRWHFNYHNYLPFHWEQYKSTIKYTYVIKAQNEEAVWSNLKESVRTDIRKAQKTSELVNDIPLDVFYDFIHKTFDRSNAVCPYSKSFLAGLIEVCKNNNACKVLAAKDTESGIYCGGVLLVYDKNTIYYLISAQNKEIKNNGAISLLIWEGIKYAIQTNKSFDFEGSMLPGVEPFFRSFGGERKAFLEISKFHSRLTYFKEGISWIKKALF